MTRGDQISLFPYTHLLPFPHLLFHVSYSPSRVPSLLLRFDFHDFAAHSLILDRISDTFKIMRYFYVRQHGITFPNDESRY